MFSGIGFSEILIIMLITLVVVGPEKIPDVARMLGKGVREVRRASNLFRDMFMLEEGGDYRQQDRREQLSEERKKVGPPGAVARDETPKRPPMRPVLIEPPRRTTGSARVGLAAAHATDACSFEQLTAPRSG